MIKQNSDINSFKTTQHHFIRNSRVLTFQRATSKELYWILITIVTHKPTLRKYFEKKFTELRLYWKEINIRKYFEKKFTELSLDWKD